MAKHVTHYYTASGWDDDYHAGCHIEVYEKTSSSMSHVTCKFCLRNHEANLAQLKREIAAQAAKQGAPNGQ